MTKKVVLIQKKWEKSRYPEGKILGYKFFDSVEETEKYMRENRLNPNLNNEIFHIIIDFNEFEEMDGK